MALKGCCKGFNSGCKAPYWYTMMYCLCPTILMQFSFFGGAAFLPSRSELNRAKFGSFGYATLNKIPKAREANGESG